MLRRIIKLSSSSSKYRVIRRWDSTNNNVESLNHRVRDIGLEITEIRKSLANIEKLLTPPIHPVDNGYTRPYAYLASIPFAVGLIICLFLVTVIGFFVIVSLANYFIQH